MKISSILLKLLANARIFQSCRPDWTDDPYAHPAIDAMSERQRADLPPAHMPVACLSEASRCGCGMA